MRKYIFLIIMMMSGFNNAQTLKFLDSDQRAVIIPTISYGATFYSEPFLDSHGYTSTRNLSLPNVYGGVNLLTSKWAMGVHISPYPRFGIIFSTGYIIPFKLKKKKR